MPRTKHLVPPVQEPAPDVVTEDDILDAERTLSEADFHQPAEDSVPHVQLMKGLQKKFGPEVHIGRATPRTIEKHLAHGVEVLKGEDGKNLPGAEGGIIFKEPMAAFKKRKLIPILESRDRANESSRKRDLGKNLKMTEENEFFREKVRVPSKKA
jgi:hypothetical protein